LFKRTDPCNKTADLSEKNALPGGSEGGGRAGAPEQERRREGGFIPKEISYWKGSPAPSQGLLILEGKGTCHLSWKMGVRC